MNSTTNTILLIYLVINASTQFFLNAKTIFEKKLLEVNFFLVLWGEYTKNIVCTKNL